MQLSGLYLRFANLIDGFLSAVLGLVLATRRFLQYRLRSAENRIGNVADARPESYQAESLRWAKDLAGSHTDSEDAVVMYENWMLWVLKTGRLLGGGGAAEHLRREMQVHSLDYLVHREVA